MANNIVVTMCGNLTDDPELRFLESGTGVCTFRVAVSDSILREGEWTDLLRGFFNVNVWRTAAEHAAENLSKGDRVIVYGILRSRSYEDSEGETRWVTEVEAIEVGRSLLFGMKQKGESKSQNRRSNRQKNSRRSKPRETEEAPA
jgi:single-strand DNA-binding protein